MQVRGILRHTQNRNKSSQAAGLSISSSFLCLASLCGPLFHFFTRHVQTIMNCSHFTTLWHISTITYIWYGFSSSCPIPLKLSPFTKPSNSLWSKFYLHISIFVLTSACERKHVVLVFLTYTHKVSLELGNTNVVYVHVLYLHNMGNNQMCCFSLSRCL